MKTINDIIDYCNNNEITCFDDIATNIDDEDFKNYVAALVVLDSKTADILDHVVNNDNLIDVLTTAAMLTKNNHESTGMIGYVDTHEAVEAINNSFAKSVIDNLLKKPDEIPNLDDSL